MPEFSDLIEDLVKDIEPEAAFEALALLQDGCKDSQVSPDSTILEKDK